MMNPRNQVNTEICTSSVGLCGVNPELGPYTFYHSNHLAKYNSPEPVQNESHVNQFLTEDYMMDMSGIQRTTIQLQETNITIDGLNFGPIQKHTQVEYSPKPDICIKTKPDHLDVSCESEVNSYTSEKVPSVSERDWDIGNELGHDNNRKYFSGHYEYSSNYCSNISRHASAAQKKYHMFGKRCLEEKTTKNKIVYTKMQISNTQETYLDCDGLENSAYVNFKEDIVSIENTGSSDNLDCTKCQFDEHLTRDEKRARNLHVPIPVLDIINLPMDEFNERISKYDLNENQLSLIRDIRRRGKNKVAAQNCRKRKLDTILSLEGEVQEVRRRKEKLLNERSLILMEKKRIANKFAFLHNLIFQYAQDSDGNPCSPTSFSLQQQADGSMFLLPRDNSK